MATFSRFFLSAYAQPELMHRKSAICVFLACLLGGGLGGCGSSGEESAPPRDPARELAHWYQGVEAAVQRMEAKQRHFIRFRVGAPPPKSGLVALSPAGARAGEVARRAAVQLDAATALTAEDAAGLYCYFFAFYADLETAPDKSEFELVIDNLVKTESSFSESASAVRDSADALRNAMLDAERTDRSGRQVAAAAFC
jgi:hypothetical protein